MQHARGYCRPGIDKEQAERKLQQSGSGKRSFAWLEQQRKGRTAERWLTPASRRYFAQQDAARAAEIRSAKGWLHQLKQTNAVHSAPEPPPPWLTEPTQSPMQQERLDIVTAILRQCNGGSQEAPTLHRRLEPRMRELLGSSGGTRACFRLTNSRLRRVTFRAGDDGDHIFGGGFIESMHIGKFYGQPQSWISSMHPFA